MARTIPDPTVHVFFAGAPEDLVTIEAILATMPLCAYGQVVVETDGELPVIELPRRVQLRRVPVASVDGDALPGEAVARAADAWLDEWMPDETTDHRRNFFAWIGCEDSPLASQAAQRVEHSLRAGLAGA